jgi:3D (Asp-Asp-Asp) domain-containing protein
VGSVAVDTRLIPHGTLLYIEDYGLAVATDTGRLIKGEMIDLWFSDTEKAKNWGRKTVKVWKVGQADLKKILSTGGKYIKY